MIPLVTILGKPGCCLCDEALNVLEEVRSQIPFEIGKRDISTDAELLDRYGDDIPVILIDGSEAFRHRVDRDRLVTLLLDR